MNKHLHTEQPALFPPDMMEKIKEAHRMLELEKQNELLKEENSHLKHQRAGHIGAYKKLKKNAGETADNQGGN